jgi:hypothetical protein
MTPTVWPDDRKYSILDIHDLRGNNESAFWNAPVTNALSWISPVRRFLISTFLLLSQFDRQRL